MKGVEEPTGEGKSPVIKKEKRKKE